MKINEKHYPHPVLSYYSEDIINSSFETLATIDNIDEGFKISIEFNLRNEILEEMIKNNEAIYLVHIESVTSKFREIHTTKNKKIEFVIDYNNIRKDIDICFFVVSLNDKNNYRNSFKAAFKNYSFQIYKGDILALAKHNIFSTSEITENNKKTSIFGFVESNAGNKKIEYFLDEEKIQIKMHTEIFDKFRQLTKTNKHYRNLLISEIVLPVLISVLADIKEEEKIYEHEGKLWFEIIKIKLIQENLDIENGDKIVDIINLSDKILGEPLYKNLSFLLDLNGEE